MASRQIRWTSIAFTTAVLAWACDTESSRRAVPTAPSPTTVVRATALKMSGPGTIHLDEATQFTVAATMSDGTEQDVTAQSAWRTSNVSLLTMASPGRFVGKAKGETSISATYQGISTTLSGVIVVPAGTFRVKGQVRDSGVPVEARLRIENQAYGNTEIDVFGQYALYGVGGDTRLTVIKSGYQEASRTEQIDDHRSIDFDLQPSRPRPEVSGSYTLTISAADTCTTLSDEARSRSYSAVINQTGATLTVTLSGPQFAVFFNQTLNRFTGLLEPERAVFRFASGGGGFFYYYYAPDVVEVLAPNVYFAFEGTAVTSIASDRLSGTLNGVIGTSRNVGGQLNPGCQSTDHRFVFTR